MGYLIVNSVIYSEDVVAVVKNFYATTDLILCIGSEILNISQDPMLELLIRKS
jgi:hypothetical protein